MSSVCNHFSPQFTTSQPKIMSAIVSSWQEWVSQALSKLDLLARQDAVRLSRNARIAIYATVGWLALVRMLRYRRVNKMQRKYPYKTRADFKNMTAADATQIQLSIFEVEFPFTAEKALQFALFR